MEIWKAVPGFGDKYEASTEGHIRDVKTGKQLAESVINSGYLTVYIPKQGINLVHRMVCSAFHQNTEPDNQVNHKNGNKEDNRPENLEWSSLGDNVRDFWQNPIFSEKQTKRKKQISKCMRERVWITDGVRNYRVLPEKLEQYPTFFRGVTHKTRSE